MTRPKNNYERLISDKRVDPRLRSSEIVKITVQLEELSDDGIVYKTRDEILKARSNPEFIEKLMEFFSQGTQNQSKDVKFLLRKEGLIIKTLSFTSKPDGNKVKINFIRPDNNDKLPGIVYFHGGGMAVGSAFDEFYDDFGRLLAREGQCAVAMIDFRNCEMPSESNPEVAPFPAGLNDCYSGLEYVNEHRNELGIDDRIIVAGESGGGNLTISVALLCKQRNRLDLISNGFYALCPYIAGDWPQSVSHKGCLGDSHLNHVNNGLLISIPDNQNSPMGYGISAFRERNILAWPGFASKEDVTGLPRCVIAVNECDPLRDEGINFYRLMVNAGVPATCRNLIGTVHGGDFCVNDVPEITVETCRAIGSFAKGVFPKPYITPRL